MIGYVFWVGWGSKFTLSHWLWWSPLQHTHTTVWACDMDNMCIIYRALMRYSVTDRSCCLCVTTLKLLYAILYTRRPPDSASEDCRLIRLRNQIHSQCWVIQRSEVARWSLNSITPTSPWRPRQVRGKSANTTTISATCPLHFIDIN